MKRAPTIIRIGIINFARRTQNGASGMQILQGREPTLNEQFRLGVAALIGDYLQGRASRHVSSLKQSQQTRSKCIALHELHLICGITKYQ